MKRRHFNRVQSGFTIMKATALVVVIVLSLYIALSTFGAIMIMEIPRLPLSGSPASIGKNYEDVSFASRDDRVLLKGWYIPNQRDFAIIFVHGGFQNRLDFDVDTLGLARDLAEKGYALLLFDLRGRGESAGKGRSLSNIERDIGGAVDYLNGKGYSAKNIGIIGFCSGAVSAAIFASGESVGGLVLDGTFASVRNIVTREATLRGIPKFLLDFFIPGLRLMTRIIYNFNEIDPIDIVPHIASPILFIHEENDNLVSLEETYQLLRASENPANELWEVSAAQHSQGYKMYPSQYVEKIDNFFTRIQSRQE